MQRPIDVHVRLNTEENRQLNQLAERTDMDRSKALRAALRAAAAMQLNNLPTCANGEPCRCPRAFPNYSHIAGVGTEHRAAAPTACLGAAAHPAPRTEKP